MPFLRKSPALAIMPSLAPYRSFSPLALAMPVAAESDGRNDVRNASVSDCSDAKRSRAFVPRCFACDAR